MVYNYYPGCTLSTKAKALDASARKCAELLGFPLTELPEWQCCGAVYPMAPDAVGERLGAARALANSRDRGGVLITLCSACHHVLKRVNNDFQHNAELQMKMNNFLELETPYKGETKVLHFLEALRDIVGFEELKKRVVNPLKGRKIGAYYGCMLLRPAGVMAMDDAENPRILEDFIRALGAEPVVYDMRNECCAGYMVVKDKSISDRMTSEIHGNAALCGAQELITACPLCEYNLNTSPYGGKLPVSYFTELLAEALGVGGDQHGA